MTSSILQAERILVVRYRFIGDTILTVPFLRNLRASYPGAQIDVLVGPQSGEVLKHCPYVNDLIVFDTTDFHKYDRGTQKRRSFLSYVFELREKRYDAVFILKRSMSSAVLAWMMGAQHRVGYATEGRQFLLTASTPWNKNIHEVESTLDVLRSAGIPIIDTHLEGWTSEDEDSTVLSMVPDLKSESGFLVHAAAAHPDKMYPLGHWAPIVRSIARQSGLVPYYTGADRDVGLYEELTRLCGIKGHNLAGKLSLRQSMSLYKHLKLAVCVDSGPSHLAAAMGTATIALFGPTDPVRWRPFGPQHIAVSNREAVCTACAARQSTSKIGSHTCLSSIDPETVVSQALAVLNKQLVRV